jgi:cobalt-zinc-cadmium resistance protein CzcA
MIRQGAVTRDGEGEAVVGIVMMLMGENSRVVVDRVKEKIAQIERTLPEGVTIDPYYDRTELVRRTIHTVARYLTEGGLLVVLVLLLLLGNLRGGLIVASAIPLSMLLAFTGMVQTRISANLMSLGAIDFGLIVDGAVVLVENVTRRLGEPGGRDRPVRQVTAEAAREVVRPVAFGIGIIIPQGRSQADYLQHTSEKVYRLFNALDLYDMYGSWWFIALLALMAINLIACSINRHIARASSSGC